MTLVAVLLLAILWGTVFVPALLRARQNASPIATVSSFRRGMRALGTGKDTSGRWVLVPKTTEEVEEPRKDALRRRRRVFSFLVLGSATTLVLGVFPSMRELLRLHVMFDLFLGAYVLFLLQLKHRYEDERMSAQFEEAAQPDEQVLEAPPAEYLHAEHF